MSDNQVTVIIPTYRNPKYLDLCLKSCIDNADSPKVIVIVDGFYDESKDVLNKYPDVGYIPLDKNMGMQYCINMGVAFAETPYVFIVNDDNVFPINWHERLIPLLFPDRVTTVNQIEPTGPGMFKFPVYDCGQTVESFDVEKFNDIELSICSDTTSPNSRIFPYVIYKKWFMCVGGFDTYYDSPNLCDWDHFLKLELLPGLRFERVNHLALYHFGSVATKKNSESQLFHAREQIAFMQYTNKWGFSPHNGKNNSKIPSGVIRGITYE